VNKPRVPVNSYTFDGPMAYQHAGDAPKYAPNCQGRRYSDVIGAVDDDWSQAGALVRDVWDDAQRDRFIHTVAGHLLNGVTGEVLERAFQYWQNVDPDTAKQIEELVRRGGDPRGSRSTGTGYVRDTGTFAVH
jgi:catalase